MAIRSFVSASNGNLNTLVAGSVVNGTTVFVGQAYNKIRAISARVQLTAATSTLTMATKWQVSADATTWYDVANGSQNAASVVVTTGTSAIVKKVIPAPELVYAYQYCRLCIVTGVATGAAGDLYVVDYTYRQLTASDNAA